MAYLNDILDLDKKVTYMRTRNEIQWKLQVVKNPCLANKLI